MDPSHPERSREPLGPSEAVPLSDVTSERSVLESGAALASALNPASGATAATDHPEVTPAPDTVPTDPGPNAGCGDPVVTASPSVTSGATVPAVFDAAAPGAAGATAAGGAQPTPDSGRRPRLPERRPPAPSISVLDVELDPMARRSKPPFVASGGLAPIPTALVGIAVGLALLGACWGIAMLVPRHPRTAARGLTGRAADDRNEIVAPSAGAPSSPESGNARLDDASGAAQPGAGGRETAAGTSMLGGPPAASSASSNRSAPQGTPSGPWRVAQLSSDPELRLVRGSAERRTFIDTLTSAGIPKAQVYRIIAAFRPIHRFDKTHRRDTFVAALSVDGRKVRAFEYEVGPTEVYQAREQSDGMLRGEKLDMHLETRIASGAVLAGDDLAASFRLAGFDPSLLELVEDAMEGRAQLSSIHPGARLRIIVEEQTSYGSFARYTDLVALEYQSAESDGAPLRVYRYRSGGVPGYYDAKGRQPFKGGWRSPVPFGRISSRFNMRRMHPVLHVIRPHNGVDFAAGTGTPVYAASSGRVLFAGDSGPSGNLVTIQHSNAITTGYAHLSRFAPHLRAGQSVEVRQLIGYVGSTGRSTGPHLHFSARKNGAFIDPLTLKLDGERVLPKNERAHFEAQRVQLDRTLDAIALPNLPDSMRPHPDADPSEPQELEPLEDERP